MVTKNSQKKQPKLNEWQLQVLKNKLPRETIIKINVLLALDVIFAFNRTKLSGFLEENGLTGYSRPNLYKILGPPVLETQIYEALEEALSRINEPQLLALIVTKTVMKKRLNMSIGCRNPAKIKKQ